MVVLKGASAPDERTDLENTRSLFSLPWFSGRVFAGLQAAMHEDGAKALSVEGAFMSQLILQLLDWQRDGALFNSGLYSFYSFCQQRVHRSKAQIYQDLWVLYMLKEKRNGYFVEFGACDGELLSNTALLEQEYGWTGILAEPNPVWHEALRRNRSCAVSTKCVHSSSGDTVQFDNIPSMPELSRMTDIIPDDVHERNGNRNEKVSLAVETISLADLLREYNAPTEIDYLSIDTEGSELAIIENFDFDAYSFRLISIEHAGDQSKRREIANILVYNGYTVWRSELSRWDDWFFK